MRCIYCHHDKRDDLLVHEKSGDIICDTCHHTLTYGHEFLFTDDFKVAMMKLVQQATLSPVFQHLTKIMTYYAQQLEQKDINDQHVTRCKQMCQWIRAHTTAEIITIADFRVFQFIFKSIEGEQFTEEKVLYTQLLALSIPPPEKN